MTWYDSVGKMAKSAFDFTGLPGLFHDIATAGSNSDPWYTDAVNITKDVANVGTTPLRATVKGFLAAGQESYKLGGIARQAIETGILDTPFMYNKYKNESESFEDYRARVDANKDKISLGQATLAAFSPGKNAGDKSGWFQNWTDNNAKFLSSGFDIFNPEDRKAAFQNQYTGKFLSGTEDLAASTFIDPLSFTGFLGKGAVIYSKGTQLENINGKIARAVFGKFAMTDERMGQILEKGLNGEGPAVKDIQFLADNDAKSQYAYWTKKKVTNPDAMSFLFGAAKTPEEVVDTFRAVMLKDKQAIAQIAEKDPEIATVLDNMEPINHPNRMALEGKLDGDIITTPEYNTAVGSYVAKMAQEDTRYREMLDKVLTGTELKYGFERGLLEGRTVNKAEKIAADSFGEPAVEFFQKTSLHPVIRVVNYLTKETPSGVFNVNDGNSFREFSTFLREANVLSKGTFAEHAGGFADSYLNAATEGERLSIIKQAETKAVEVLFPNYSPDEIDKLYGIFDARRANAIAIHNKQGFISHFDGDQVVASHNPLLQRESANQVVIMDLRKLKYGIDAHERVLPNLLSNINVEDITNRTQKGLAAMDTINDVFKTSVLLRLGYTVRNLAEAQLSMLAKGFALPSVVASGGKDAVNRFFNNRKVGFNRIADNVNVLLGKVDDLKTMQYEFASETDKLRSIDMGRQQLAKAVSQRLNELEKGKFKQRLTTGPEGIGAGSLTIEDEVKLLKGALADLESITVYHGSANTKLKLDGVRALAASASPSIARRYTGTGTIHSTEDYLQTPSGRPGKITQEPGQPLPEVAAQKRVDTAAKQLAQAEKDLAQSGKTQWDVPLLKQTLAEAKTELKKAKSAGAVAQRRASTVNEATDMLKSDMISAVNAGKTVEIKRAGGWKKVDALTWDNIKIAEEGEFAFKPEDYRRSVFRVNAGVGSVHGVRVYGKPIYMTKWGDIPLEMRDEVFGGKASNFKSWIVSKGWSNPNDPVFKYMRDNGYGRAVVTDDARAGGVTHIALPESVGAKGRLNEVKRYVSKVQEEGAIKAADVMEPMEQRLATPKERRIARQRALRAEKIGRENAVSPYYNQDSANAMINNGLQDAVENLSREFANSHAHLDDMASRIGARIDASESMAIKQRLGYGNQDIIDANGHSYTLPKVFEGASWFLGRTGAEDTWNAMVHSQEMAFMTGIGSRSVRLVQPNDPRYFEAWANILNMHFRDPESGIMDPVVRQILDNKTDKQLLSWFKTHEGSLYANNTYTRVGEGYGFTKLKGGELDEELLKKIQETRGAVKLYIPDNDTALMLSAAKETGAPLSGGEVQKYLVDRFGSNPENLKPINGLLVTTSKEYKDQERLIDTMNRRFMRFLGSLPEDVFARHPLASAVYDRQLRLNIAKISAAKDSEKLTANEVNRAVNAAREESRREVERTLFTITRRTGASGSRAIKLLFPFYAAFENTAQRWGGMLADDPSIATNASRVISQVVNGQLVVDQNGNQVTDATKVGGNTNLVIRVPQGFIDSMPKSWRGIIQDSFSNINIPLSSLDVITQGQPGNPGFGPFAVLPAYLVLKQRPELENALSPFFPAGMPSSASDLFTPSVLRRLGTVWKKDDLYVRTYNQMLRYETYNYNQGKRTDAPTVDEITSRTNKFFFLRALTSISAPFAIAPEVDFYAQTYRKFQQQYAGTPGEAEAKFLQMYPDFFEATISLSKNVGGLEPSVDTVRNLRKFSNLMSYAQQQGDPELMGFLANDGDGKYTFSSAAYQWQYGHGATPGSANNYRRNRTADELLKDADVKRGWSEYQNVMGQISAYKIQNGITDDNDPAMARVKEVKKLWLQEQAKSNLAWYSAYSSPDRTKYERRAQILEKTFQDKKWMEQNGNRPVVKSAILYLDARKQIGEVLAAREKTGGSAVITAKSNSDLAYVLDKFRTQLIAGSPEFEQFLNRYFASDTVVI